MLCRFVSYCMSRVDVLRAAGVTPVIVFDGGRLPMKEGEEESRSRYETVPAILDEGAHGLQESTPPIIYQHFLSADSSLMGWWLGHASHALNGFLHVPCRHSPIVFAGEGKKTLQRRGRYMAVATPLLHMSSTRGLLTSAQPQRSNSLRQAHLALMSKPSHSLACWVRTC